MIHIKYIQDIHLSGIDLDSFINHPYQFEIQKILNQSFSLTYLDKERFLNIYKIYKFIKNNNLRISFDELKLLLWIMANSYDLFHFSFQIQIKEFSDYHFIVNNSMLLQQAYKFFYKELETLYEKIYKKKFSSELLDSLLDINLYIHTSDNLKEKIYIYSKILKDIHTMEKILEQYSLDKVQLKKQIIQRIKNLFPEKKEPHNQSISYKRAVDDPQWKKMEESGNIDWNIVLRSMGTNLFIRIALRKQNYKIISDFIKEGYLGNDTDLRYIKESMKKIREHGDIEISKEIEYNELWDLLTKMGY